MTMRCTICSYDKRIDIDREIVRSVPHTKIAKTYGVDNLAARSHTMNHLSRQMLKHVEIRGMFHKKNLLSDINEKNRCFGSGSETQPLLYFWEKSLRLLNSPFSQKR